MQSTIPIHITMLAFHASHSRNLWRKQLDCKNIWRWIVRLQVNFNSTQSCYNLYYQVVSCILLEGVTHLTRVGPVPWSVHYRLSAGYAILQLANTPERSSVHVDKSCVILATSPKPCVFHSWRERTDLDPNVGGSRTLCILWVRTRSTSAITPLCKLVLYQWRPVSLSLSTKTPYWHRYRLETQQTIRCDVAIVRSIPLSRWYKLHTIVVYVLGVIRFSISHVEYIERFVKSKNWPRDQMYALIAQHRTYQREAKCWINFHKNIMINIW